MCRREFFGLYCQISMATSLHLRICITSRTKEEIRRRKSAFSLYFIDSKEVSEMFNKNLVMAISSIIDEMIFKQ